VGAVLVPALVVLAVLAASAATMLLVRRRRIASAAVGNGPGRTVELGVPTANGGKQSTTQVRR
jgi:hypothetical protein